METKWELLQKESKPESKLEPMLKSYIISLQAKLERVKKDKEHLDTELRNVHAQVEEQKQRSVIIHFIFSLEPDSKLDSNYHKQNRILIFDSIFLILIVSTFLHSVLLQISMQNYVWHCCENSILESLFLRT